MEGGDGLPIEAKKSDQVRKDHALRNIILTLIALAAILLGTLIVLLIP